MQELLAELKRIERQQSVLQDAVQNSKTVIAHPRVTATPPDSPEKPKEPEDRFIASGERVMCFKAFCLCSNTLMRMPCIGLPANILVHRSFATQCRKSVLRLHMRDSPVAFLLRQSSAFIKL